MIKIDIDTFKQLHEATMAQAIADQDELNMAQLMYELVVDEQAANGGSACSQPSFGTYCDVTIDF